MKFFPFTKQSWNSWLATLIGLLTFVSLTGGRIVSPQNIDWLMMDGDPQQQFLGWHFFRNAPLFQLPIGANPGYGLDIGSSIVYTDSIPLLALFFKPFGVILPDTFQYIGIWVLLCFVLQSLFAYKLLYCFTKERWLQLLGCGFFVVAPAFLWRLHGHYALAGQWVLLAGLYFYFSQKFSPLRWMGLLGVTALIHAYLLLMVAALWVADLLQRIVRKKVKISQALVFVLAGCAVAATVMWLAGYFMVGGGVPSVGSFGVYRMNLLSLIDPDDIWSRVLRDQLGGKGDYEGFNYLGLGVILLGLVACYEAVRTSKLAIDWRAVGPLMLLSFVLTVIAISNHVAFGNHELFVIDLPSVIDRLCAVFRSSGRFFWPVYYALYIGIFYILVNVLERRLAIALFAVMLCAQVVDSSAAFSHFRKKFRDAPTWTSPLRSSFWGGVSSVYKKIIFVLPHNAPGSYLPLAYFAASNRMAINVGYFARVDPNKERKAKGEIAASVIFNELDHDSLYVFEDDGLWRIASSQAASSDAVGIVDGFRVLAPKWKDCAVCDRQAIGSIGAEKVSEYKKEGIVFTAKGNSKDYVAGGWSSPGEVGTWSDGDSSAVVLQLATLPETDLFLSIEGHAFVNDKHPIQEVDLLVNRRLLERLTYTIAASAGMRVVKIPQALIAQNDGHLVIQFKFKNPKSPAELRLSGDVRRLGLELVSLRLDTTN